jgi:glycosyltransferase involved in cell wall biosynthesis
MILTIIVPVFNIMQRKEFLLPTLRSVVNQTLYPQIKLLVVDDGSSDDTVKYVRSIQSQFESQINFEFIPLSQNLGKHHLLNEIVRSKVATPYLMILDSDDLLLPTAAEEMLKLFQENPQLSCVKTAQVILSDHKITHRSIAPLGSDFYRRYIHHFGAYIGNTGSIWSIEAFKKTIKNWDPKEKLYPLSRMACEDTLRLYLLPDFQEFLLAHQTHQY